MTVPLPLPIPLPPAALVVAAGVLVLALARRRAPRPDRARVEELAGYKALVGRAADLLDAGRLTDAKVLVDDHLWRVRSAARLDERSRYIPSAVRREVWARDGGACVRCDAEDDLQFDHVIAFSKGGAHTAANLELLCGRCNRAKAARIE